MKTNLIYLILSTFLLSCTGKKICSAVIFYEGQNDKTYDSVFIENEDELKLLNKVMSDKIQMGAIFPREYDLKVVYNDSTSEEYDGNSTLLRADHIYRISDKNLRKEYLKLINSKLPPYRQQTALEY